MREILFRGKRKDNGEWVEGNYVFCDKKHYIFDEVYYKVIPETVGQFTGLYDGTQWDDLTEAEKKKFYFSVYSEDGISIKYPTIESVESLWNGKKIFEGDIIHSFYANCKINEYIEKVVFRDGSFKAENVEGGFFAKIAGQGSPKHLPNDTSVYMIECEVIGNIHDNPELLKEVWQI